jgi:hypothetical protein
MLCPVDSVALLSVIFCAHFARVVGHYPSGYSMKHGSSMMVSQPISMTSPDLNYFGDI